MRHTGDMFHDGVRKIHSLPPEVLELISNPLRGAGILIAPQDLVGVAEARGAIVHAADERKHPSVEMFDYSSLAVDEDVVRIARDNTHLHPAADQKIVQASVALPCQ